MRHRSSGRACCLTPWREDLRPLPADGALPLRMRAERAFLPGKQREASHGAPRSFARQRAPLRMNRLLERQGGDVHAAGPTIKVRPEPFSLHAVHRASIFDPTLDPGDNSRSLDSPSPRQRGSGSARDDRDFGLGGYKTGSRSPCVREGFD